MRIIILSIFFILTHANASVPLPTKEVILNDLRKHTAVTAPEYPAHPSRYLYNKEAPIPPMCYTKTEANFNPCYVCHQDNQPGRENQMDDGSIQAGYEFSDLGVHNHWDNLFTPPKADVTDEFIQQWVNADNYTALPKRLDDAGFKGYIPDLTNLHLGADAFDENGFARDNSGWVAFNYKPFPSTFWPTNGATDDVMIRLADVFQKDTNNQLNLHIYKANLCILEAVIKQVNEIDCLTIDEQAIGEDLNNDNKLSSINRIINPKNYVGLAKNQYFELGIYPQGTEFLHTVRYLGLDDEQRVSYSTRIKEVRYMKKWQAVPKATLAQLYLEENFEKELGQLPYYKTIGDYGLDNGFGWSVQGFIENAHGDLRQATHEETFFCMGCHSSIGATIDKTFSFARKQDGQRGWGYINLRGMQDAPTKGESKGGYHTYLERVGGGSEFRNNEEIQARFFNGTTLLPEKLANLDVYDLITPSKQRAIALNKAYYAIVLSQSYLQGRDPVLKPNTHVFKKIDPETAPTLPTHKQHTWHPVLDWQHNNN